MVLLAGFVAVERRAAQPLVPLRIFADRQRSGTYLVLVLSSTAMFGVYFFMTLFLQRVWGYSAATTALVYIPMSLVLMGAARGSAKLVGPLGARNLTLVGLVLAAGGTGLAVGDRRERRVPARGCSCRPCWYTRASG